MPWSLGLDLKESQPAEEHLALFPDNALQWFFSDKQIGGICSLFSSVILIFSHP